MESKRTLIFDYETYSELDIKKVGGHKYAQHPSTEILMVAWKFTDSDEIGFWDNTMPEEDLDELKGYLRDDNIIKRAFNAQFERLITKHVLGIDTPYDVWRCTMVAAYHRGFTGGLDMVGKALGFKGDKAKDAAGKRLIQKFCKPRKPTKLDKSTRHDAESHPEEWEAFGAYCRQDVIAEENIDRRLSNIKYDMIEFEWEVYALDQKINDRGINIDNDFIEAAIKMAETRKPQIIDEMRELTGLANPGSQKQLLAWLQQEGYPFNDLLADTVKKVINEYPDNGITEKACCVLKLRRKSNKTSLKKYNKMLDIENDDGRVRGTIQCYGGSRTGRFAGRGLQTHNFVRTPKILEDVEATEIAKKLVLDQDMWALNVFAGEPMDMLPGLLRSALIPTVGRRFVVADLSSIESVVIGWLTGCKWFLDTLRAKKDLYRAFASAWLKIPYEDTLPFRGKAKPATLGCGYRLGGGELIDGKKTGLWGYGENMGVMLTQEEAHASVDAFRELCPEIVDGWYKLEDCVKTTIKTHKTTRWRSLVFGFKKPFLWIKLPSGRKLYYYRPRLVTNTYKNRRGETYTRQEIMYEGKKDQGGWGVQTTHGGKLIENIVQAIARDVLVNGMFNAEKMGFDIVFHVHDEIITEVDEDDLLGLDDLIDCMAAPIPWAPGLPLGAAGWEGYFYRKD